jgi:hypothetical protein
MPPPKTRGLLPILMGPKFTVLIFPSTAQSPDQDVSGDDPIHLGAAQTQLLCLIIIHSLDV